MGLFVRVTAQTVAIIGDGFFPPSPAGGGMRIKIRHRGIPPEPWKWEIYVGKRLITASDDFYATQEDAHGAGRDALDQILLDYANIR